jgi:hypothetical protein
LISSIRGRLIKTSSLSPASRNEKASSFELAFLFLFRQKQIIQHLGNQSYFLSV